jgi:hypothetical protein
MVNWKSLELYSPRAKQPRQYRKMLRHRTPKPTGNAELDSRVFNHDGRLHSYEVSWRSVAYCSECGDSLEGHRADAVLCGRVKCHKAAYRRRLKERKALEVSQ